MTDKLRAWAEATLSGAFDKIPGSDINAALAVLESVAREHAEFYRKRQETGQARAGAYRSEAGHDAGVASVIVEGLAPGNADNRRAKFPTRIDDGDAA